MQEIKIKAKQHLLVIEIPSDMSKDGMDELSSKLRKNFPELNVILSQPETKLTVLTLED